MRRWNRRGRSSFVERRCGKRAGRSGKVEVEAATSERRRAEHGQEGKEGMAGRKGRANRANSEQGDGPAGCGEQDSQPASQPGQFSFRQTAACTPFPHSASCQPSSPPPSLEGKGTKRGDGLWIARRQGAGGGGRRPLSVHAHTFTSSYPQIHTHTHTHADTRHARVSQRASQASSGL